MDKLEPLIKHRFWIIFGLTLPITLFAYYSASGKMADATTQKESLLDSTLNEIPKGDTEPNQTYAEGAKIINQELKQLYKQQVQKLWESQTDRMSWPKVIVDYVPNDYRAEIDSDACYTYMRIYPSVLERLWKRVQPYVGDPKTNQALADIIVDWPQKVLIDGHAIPHENFNLALPANSEDIWDAQEDIWLMELIFDAVVRTNEDAAYVSESPVRQIDKIMLVGGSGQSTVTAAPAAAGEGSYGTEAGYAEDYGMMEMGGGYGEMGRGGGASVPVEFNVAEEFGPQEPAETETAETTTASTGSYGEDAYSEGYGGGGYGGMGFGMGGPGVKMKRYIGDTNLESGPYRERGFYMSVLILQDRIPEFLTELSSSPWPIRIGRFHIGPNPYASKTPSASPFGGRMALGGGYGEYDDYDDMDYGGGSYGGYGGGFGGYGMGMGMGGRGATPLNLPAYMKMPTSIDPSLRGAPELVQMDFCGIITMYNPQTDDSVEAVDDGSTEAEFADDLAETPETVEEAAAMAQEAAAEAAATAGSDNPAGAVPSAPGAPSPPATDQPASGGPSPPTGEAPPSPPAEAQPPTDDSSPPEAPDGPDQ